MSKWDVLKFRDATRLVLLRFLYISLIAVAGRSRASCLIPYQSVAPNSDFVLENRECFWLFRQDLELASNFGGPVCASRFHIGLDIFIHLRLVWHVKNVEPLFEADASGERTKDQK